MSLPSSTWSAAADLLPSAQPALLRLPAAARLQEDSRPEQYAPALALSAAAVAALPAFAASSESRRFQHSCCASTRRFSRPWVSCRPTHAVGEILQQLRLSRHLSLLTKGRFILVLCTQRSLRCGLCVRCTFMIAPALHSATALLFHKRTCRPVDCVLVYMYILVALIAALLR